ncbi:hypothetical protein GPECTOR_5g211 [Gonium pectorale]|uniref:F-box domain-containing protein n=1 Tax=Gonium pectorale TaxID=33097 RepID=A0A150GWD1_GONPE|nr:hypothetical protein GPECTOR_5g211 [Gonium pectorale]|eukprot:KXZ54109.1 hypothetical protein GPECTOR_5g211 [Gonium pectorale]
MSTVTREQNTSTRVWLQLLPELTEKIVSFLDPNEVPSFRLVSKAAATQFRGATQTTIRLSRPVPPHAFAAHWLAPGATRGLTLERRRQLLRLTAASGVVANLGVALQAAGCLLTADVFEEAAATGQLDSCQWLLERGCPLADEDIGGLGVSWLLAAAAGGGHRHVCEWLLGLGAAWKSCGAGEAARSGHVGLAEWLLQRLPQLDVRDGAESEKLRLLEGVAHGCDLATLQRLWRGCGELGAGAKEETLAAAAGSPTPDWAAKVEWLEAQGCRPFDGVAWRAAACPDAAERLVWLRARGYPLTPWAIDVAARDLNVPAVRYLLSCEQQQTVWHFDSALTRAACGKGQLETLQALRADGWPMDAASCAFAAARAGHLHVLAWLAEACGRHGALLCGRGELLEAAAESGSVELLAWLRARGCGWGGEELTSAAEAGCGAAVEWLVAQGCPVEDRGAPYAQACLNGDLAMARLLRRLGVPWGPAGRVVSDAAGRAPLPLLRWLLEEGCPVGDYEAARAAAVERNGGAAEALELLEEWHRRA